jgi:hypothetical protein
MKTLMLITAIVLGLWGTTAPAADQAKSAGPTENKTFELSPAAPPIPALKYQLMFDDAGDRISGNAAILYLDSVLLLNSETREKIQNAHEAYETDKKTFSSIADSIEASSALKEVELAGRRIDCNWESPFREMGAETLLPHLEPLLKGVGRLLSVRAHRQIQKGKTDEAIKTIRLGYEMSDKIGREGTLVSALVALAVAGMMDDCVVELANRPESPNLFWALSVLPRRQNLLRHSLDVESQWAVRWVSNLASVRTDDQLSADQWRAVFANLQRLIDLGSTNGHTQRPDVVKDASKETLEKARKEYAAAHHVTTKQVTEVDPICVLGEYYLRQYEVAYDEWSKCRGLAYPALMERAKAFDSWSKKLKEEQRSNPLAHTLPVMTDVVRKFARADRQLAALTTVEALRAYASTNGGKLPEQLDDIVETPVPANPTTGKPFTYGVSNGTATLSDATLGDHFEYTIRIRGNGSH